jgi:hypothetical protein
LSEDAISLSDIQVYILNLPEGCAGFAAAFENREGLLVRQVIIDSDLFQKRHLLRQNSKTLAHLIANSVGLSSLWDKNEIIEDTPWHVEQNFGEASKKGVHVSFLPGMPREFVYNLMDNVADRRAVDLTKAQQRFLVSRFQQVNLNSKYNPEDCVEGRMRRAVDSTNIDLPTDSFADYIYASPNPAKHHAEIQFAEITEMSGQLGIYDQHGQIVYSTNLPVGSTLLLLNLENFSDGLYRINLTRGNGKTTTSSFVKTK